MVCPGWRMLGHMNRRQHLDITGKLAHLGADSVNGVAVEVFKALGNESRWRILNYLSERFVSVNQIAQDLRLPASTTSRHIALLEDVGLVHTGMRPASRGLEKVVARRFEAILVDLPRRDGHDDHVVEVSMPIGAYMDFKVEPTCGLAGADGLIGLQDDESSFYDPERVGAQLLWFGAGYVEYQFPNRTPAGSVVASVGLSCEVCSEAPLYDADWPSDGERVDQRRPPRGVDVSRRLRRSTRPPYTWVVALDEYPVRAAEALAGER